MAQSESIRAGIPMLLLTLLVGYGSWSASQVLRTARQPPPASIAALPAKSGEVNARLWQDPISAVRGQEKPYCAHRPELATPAKLALLVCTSGGGFVEDSERRLRDRYAVVAGLARCGYVPDDPEHLSWYFPISNIRSPVPYETFRLEPENGPRSETNAPTNSKVIVAWLCDTEFTGAALVEGIKATVKSLRAHNGLDEDSKVAVIGPTFSDDLVELCLAERGDAKDRLKGLSQGDLRVVHWYSPSATIAHDPLAAAMRDRGDGDAAQRIERGCDGLLGGVIARTIATDDALTDLLVRELYLRRALSTARGSMIGRWEGRRVVIISELDTPYSRGISGAFDRSLRGENAISASLPVRERRAFDRERRATHVDHYTVLRGLDGVASGDATAKESRESDPKKDRDAGTLSLPTRAADRPTGSAQYDYLRRLAQRIKDDELNTIDAKGTVSAVGIFGTDVYDKLLVLQALRPFFPGVVFFTTDLDSRLLMPDQNAWSRNLVVASGFGLQLGPELQGATPPFRECYQTSMYFSVLRACADAGYAPTARPAAPARACADQAPPELATVPLGHPEPHVYEVGRSDAWDLSAADHNSPIAPKDLPPWWGRYLVSGPWALGATVLILVFASIVLVNTWLTSSASGTKPSADQIFRWLAYQLFDSRRDWLRVGLWAVLALFALFTIGYVGRWLVLHQSPANGGEPFDWFEGISVWPTEVLRMALMFMIALCGVVLIRNWESGMREFEARYGLAEEATNASSRIAISGWYYEPDADGTVNAVKLWSQYAARSRTAPRLARVALFTAGYFAFCLCLFLSMRMPPRPCRGDWAFTWDIVLVILSTTLAAALTLLVWDAVRLCDRFTRFLTGPMATRYSTKTLELIAQHHGWDSELAPSWMDIKLIASRTDAVSRAMYYPVAALFLLVIARSTIFDDWRWGLPLFVALGANAGVMLLAGWLLRRTAENARKFELRRLRAILATAITASNAPDLSPDPNPTIAAEARERADRAREFALRRAARVQELITDIKENKEGTFAPWSHHPVIGSLLLPSGGALALWLIDVVGKMMSP